MIVWLSSEPELAIIELTNKLLALGHTLDENPKTMPEHSGSKTKKHYNLNGPMWAVDDLYFLVEGGTMHVGFGIRKSGFSGRLYRCLWLVIEDVCTGKPTMNRPRSNLILTVYVIFQVKKLGLQLNFFFSNWNPRPAPRLWPVGIDDYSVQKWRPGYLGRYPEMEYLGSIRDSVKVKTFHRLGSWNHWPCLDMHKYWS